jgi:hypothetical protein
MTQVGEGVAVMLMLPESTSTIYNCDWRCTPGQSGKHDGKWHMADPPYPKGGKAERDDGAPKSWKDTHNLVPWLYPEKADGVDSYHTDREYHIARGSPASSYPYPTYATEGHHCISCDLFKESEYPELVHNALLLGYDVNCKENGYHVPAYVVDIVCHDLQHHASSHTWSAPAPLKYDLDEKSAPLLTQLQERQYKYCTSDPEGKAESQKRLLADLHAVSDIVRGKLKRWRWYLTKLAKMTLADVRAYGVPVAKPPGVTNKAVKGGVFSIQRAYQEAAFTRENLMPSGFPDWDHYIAAALEELDNGANPNQPFSRWISRRMLREKLGRARKPGAPVT